MADDDDLTIRLRVAGNRQFNRQVDQSARRIDNLGDQAGQAARKLARLNAVSTKTRISFGPISTSARGAGLAIGSLALATGKGTTALLGFSEATATVVGGAGAAGGVGLLALAQGMGVVKLATQNFTQALGGNKKALERLTPAQAKFLGQLQRLQPKFDKLKNTAAQGLFGGANRGLKSASANFGVLSSIVKGTSGALGGLAADAGKTVGSRGFGRDLGALGGANVQIINNLGHAGLSLANALRHILVEAAPLTVWLSQMALRASVLTEEWARNARQTGELSRFFQRARTDLTLLASIGGHAGRGILNLFGAQDVDGTKTLASLDRIFATFERWTKSPAVQRGVGQAIIDQIPNAAGAIASVLARTFGDAAPLAARIFIKSFLDADAWGKLLIGGVVAKKLGLGAVASKALSAALGGGGKGGGVAGALAARGTVTNPMWVRVLGGPLPNKGSKLPPIIPSGGGGSFLRSLPGVGAVVGTGIAINHALDKHFGISKRRNQPHTPRNAVGDFLHKILPGFASGGITPGGPVLVGERGPEILAPPRGSQVTPIGLGGFVFHNVLMLDGRVVYEAYNRQDRSEKARH